MESSEQISNSKKKRGYVCAVNSCKSKSRENLRRFELPFLPSYRSEFYQNLQLFWQSWKNRRVVCMEESNKNERRRISFEGVFTSFYPRRFSIIKLTNGNIAKLPTRACTFLLFLLYKNIQTSWLHPCAKFGHEFYAARLLLCPNILYTRQTVQYCLHHNHFLFFHRSLSGLHLTLSLPRLKFLFPGSVSAHWQNSWIVIIIIYYENKQNRVCK